MYCCLTQWHLNFEWHNGSFNPHLPESSQSVYNICTMLKLLCRDCSYVSWPRQEKSKRLEPLRQGTAHTIADLNKGGVLCTSTSPTHPPTHTHAHRHTCVHKLAHTCTTLNLHNAPACMHKHEHYQGILEEAGRGVGAIRT